MLKRSPIATFLTMMTLLALPGAAALADNHPQWTFVEGGYLGVDVDNLDGSGSNWFLGGSFGLGKSWHVLADYTDGELGDTVDQTMWRIGGGFGGGLGKRADIVAELFYIDQETVSSGPLGTKVSDDGWGATVGVRWRIIKLFEVDGFINYSDLGVFGDQIGYELRGILNIWRIGFGVSYQVIDADFSDVAEYNGFVRFNFK